MRFRLGRWAVQLDRAGLVVLDLVEHRRRHPKRRRGVLPEGVNLYPQGCGPGGGVPPAAGGSAGAMAQLSEAISPDVLAAAAQPRRQDEGFGLLHLREAHRRGLEGRRLR